MKKTLVVVLMVMMFSGMAVSVQAANVSFNPGSVALTVEPGKSAAATLLVNVSSTAPVYIISMMVGSAVEGNLPPGWLKQATVKLDPIVGGSSPSVNLEVNVPAGTPAGKYSAVVTPQVIQATEQVVSNDINLEVDVPSQNSCDGVPALEDVKVGPGNIWAPRDKKVVIDVSGTVVLTTGCEVTGTYTMDSNDGAVSGDLDIDEAGNFAVKIPIKVAKESKAKDGAIYKGMLSVEDAMGNMTSQEFFVQVDHDRDSDECKARQYKGFEAKNSKGHGHDPRNRYSQKLVAHDDHDRRR